MTDPILMYIAFLTEQNKTVRVRVEMTEDIARHLASDKLGQLARLFQNIRDRDVQEVQAVFGLWFGNVKVDIV